MKVEATDADADENALIAYEIKDQILPLSFAINSSSGEITTVRQLDREKQRQYTFRVVATDGGKKSTTATATVLMKDKNDEAPAFPSSQYNITVSEHQVGGVVAVMSANDPDSSDDGKLSFQLKSQHNFFAMQTVCSTTTCKGLVKIIKVSKLCICQFVVTDFPCMDLCYVPLPLYTVTPL